MNNTIGHEESLTENRSSCALGIVALREHQDGTQTSDLNSRLQCCSGQLSVDKMLSNGLVDLGVVFMNLYPMLCSCKLIFYEYIIEKRSYIRARASLEFESCPPLRTYQLESTWIRDMACSGLRSSMARSGQVRSDGRGHLRWV